jgi:hypothetical protein
MPTERDHLRDSVITGVRAVDDVFRRLAEQVRAIMGTSRLPFDRSARRQAMRLIDGVLDRVFGLTQRAALVSELFGVLTGAMNTTTAGVFSRAIAKVRDVVQDARPGLWQRIVSLPPSDPFTRVVAAFEHWDQFGNRVIPRSVGAERAARARLFDANRRWVDPDGYRLSDRVWKGGRQVRKQIDRILVDGIRNGDSAVDIAAKLERYLNPDKAPIKYQKNGRIIRKNTTRTPYGSHGSSFARSLARTEITRVHGQAVIESMKVLPGGGNVQWRLSASHPKPDQCDDNASRDSYDLGPGVYPPDQVPRYPNHPQDICALLPVVPSRADVLDAIVREYEA